jgi:hypothetical protein
MKLCLIGMMGNQGDTDDNQERRSWDCQAPQAGS